MYSHMPHSYRITVQSLATDPPAIHPEGLSFDVTNHDELFQLVERVRGGGVLPKEEVAEFTIGLKLFSEVMLRHRREPLFADLFPHFGTFMKQLKGGAKKEAAQG